ncbi:endothelin-converting enzyme 1 precursor [Bacteroides reticulotermitis JCM 10512]|uniref:Endothelin-converting enzyme 1 n=1 Tax=Bacteroides reticulotermitis JCM 10512 TaxID=1445607 RepID=W4UZG0_9BACE|nr:endothelin-converting enzyme 1 precursor [Bacteroides reticulotermitis JCM 10512]
MSGIDLANLDTTVRGTSFYEYACGGWIKNHPLTDEYSRYGSFDMLAENNQKQLRSLIEELAAKKDNAAGSVAQKVGDLYNLAMDSVKLNQDGATPIKAELEQLAAIKDKSAIYPAVAELYKKGIHPFLGIYVGADDMNSSMNIVHAYQGGLGMGERDYYLENDDHTKEIRAKYQEHVAKMFLLAGFDEAAAQKAVKGIMNIENRLAKASRTQVALRDPHANYNKKKIEELKAEFASFDWDVFFNTAGLNNLKEVNVSQPEFVKEVSDIINTVALDDQIAYLQWNLIDNAASFLSDAFVAQNFDFYGKTMSGTQEQKPRWKRAVSTVDGSLGEAVGQMYVEKYFPAAAKERMVALVKNLQTSLGERIQNLSWMSDATKVKAQEKLATFHVKIGYPDKWKDYTSLDIQKDSYWANIERANLWEYKEMIAKVGKPVDKDEWLMTPQTVNAYYNPTTNEICFPAGILQYPFFDMNADDAFNYGAIGVVIGHEMTHGFDDQGRQYDKDGNLKDWWTEEDAKKFEARTAVMAHFFDSIQVAPGVHANGELTLGENIADHGGLQVSFQAFKKATAAKPLAAIDGFTPEQRFFLSYANVWAGNIRPEEILRLTKLDPHSLGKWRVDGALPHIGAWYEAFQITDKDPLYLPVEKRVSIW